MITSSLLLPRRRRSATRKAAPSLLAAAFVASLLVAGPAPAALAVTPSNGVAVAARSTIPRGAIFLNDGQGGHWWVGDSLLGVCRLDSQAGPPPFFLNGCSGAAKSGGQLVVGPSTVAGAQYLYAADSATKSINVVRFLFTPGAAGAAGNISSPLAMQVNNPTFVGGGSGGGRPVALALAPNGADLYVGYLKSGDVMKIIGAETAVNATPPVAKIGSTSDGKGVNAFVMFGNDLFLAEIGGFGMSRIADPSGVARTACSAASPCTAVSLSPNPDFFPGGLATDWTGGPTAGKYIFIGDARLAAASNPILRYDPATGITDTYSLNISPSYISGGTTFSSFIGPLALAYNSATGDLYVGDDPQFSAAVPVLQQGHFWKVPHPAIAVIPTISAIAPTSGTSLGGDVVTITGTNLTSTDPVTLIVTLPTIAFGINGGIGVACASATSCTATSPAGSGTVDIRATIGGQTSAATAADQFTFVAPASNAITVTGVAPNAGSTLGGTHVAITGTNLATVDAAGAITALPTINFGATAATGIACTSAPNPATPGAFLVNTCTAINPAEAAGVVDVQATLNAQTSVVNPGDKFTYVTPTASLFAWGITAPKGGAAWLPGALGGHWWSSDHAQGLCRQDPMSSAPAPFAIAGDTLDALNFAVCGNDLVGSAGQAVYDARPVVNLATGVATTLHYVYVPDNAVKSTAVWRLSFDPATETMVADPNGGALATAMTPLADVRTLKPNGMALGPDGNLYVTDLVEPNVRKITNPNGDPRTQVISIVAVTGDGRGANGTQGFIGNLLYISGNRAAQFFDITQCPLAGGPCGMASVPAPTGVFVAGTATDAPHNFVYLSNSGGGGPATIFRYDASHDVYVAFAPGTYPADAFGVVHCAACTFGPTAQSYITGGVLPAPGTANGTVTCSLTCQRPWDQGNHPTTGIPAGQGVPTSFAFVFGLGMDPSGNLAITEDPSAGARSGRGTMWTVPFLP
jgi:hypothetical protein